MNAIAPIQATMSSREIAELTGSRHDAVRKSAERLAADQILTSPLAGFKYEHRGNTYQEYHFNKRDSLVLVARLSPEFTAAVVDRWQELEEKQNALPDFNDPVIAARAWADAKESEQAALAQLEQAKPAVEFVGRFVDTGTTKTVRETSKLLGLPEKAFIQALIDDKILYRQSGNLLPHQRHHAADRFTVKTGERNGYAYTQTRVTATGIDWLANRYGDWIGEKA